jgi:hypothetical protein
MHKDVLRLAGLLACVALATSRLGLIGHELVGHACVALALGGTVDRVQLFWFAGGWIRYHLDEPSPGAALAIAMGGIALEFIAGGVLWFAVRGHTLGRRILRGTGAALVLHASWYLAAGAFHGFGDGLLLYRMLGDWRVPVAIAAGAVTCVAGFAGAREVLGALAGTLGGSARARIIKMTVAVLFAAGLHAGLAAGELHLRRDPTYAGVMRPERERVIAKEVARWEAQQVERGIQVTPEQKRVDQTKIARAHKTFPFLWLLGVATGLAILAGARRSKPASETRITNRLVVTAVAIVLASLIAVVVIDSLVV